MSREQVQEHLVERAQSDTTFRDALVRDPRATIENEIGLRIPPQIQVSVVEESSDRLCLVLPAAAGELSDLELEAVAGGSTSGCAGLDTRIVPPWTPNHT